MNEADALVSTDWLAAHLDDPNLRVVNAAGGGATRRGHADEGLQLSGDAATDFEKHHIPGAVLVDFDQLSDHTNPLPNMLPAPAAFAEAAGGLGLGDGHRIIVYDCMGLRIAPRVWWMFRVFGHEQVAVLDGGLPKWVAEGRPLQTGRSTPTPASFAPRFLADMIIDLAVMQEIQRARTRQVLDARPPGRYEGREPEPRGAIPSGHMPWSLNVPVECLVDGASGTLFPRDTLRANLHGLGVDVTRPAVATCGWGIASCTLALAFHALGRDLPVYDGSWAEWASADGAAVL